MREFDEKGSLEHNVTISIRMTVVVITFHNKISIYM